MRILRRISTPFLFLLPLIAVGALGAVSVSRYIGTIQIDSARYVSNQLSRMLGVEVQIDRLGVLNGSFSVNAAGPHGRGRVWAEGVRIASGPALNRDGMLASVERVEADADLDRILKGTVPDQSMVGAIVLKSPKLFLSRSRTGGWNFEKILKPDTKRAARSPIGEIRMHNGQVYVLDEQYTIAGKRVRLQTHLTGLEAEASLWPDGSVGWNGSALSADLLAGRLRSTGRFDASARRVSGWAEADGLRLGAVWRLLPLREAALTQGRADLISGFEVSLPKKGSPRWSATANARVSDVLGTTAWTEGTVRIRSADVALKDNTLRFEAEGGIGEAAAQLTGSITDLQKPTIAVSAKVSSPNSRSLLNSVRLNHLIASVPHLDASAELSLNLRGPISRPWLDLAGALQVSGKIWERIQLGAPTKVTGRLKGYPDELRWKASARLARIWWDEDLRSNVDVDAEGSLQDINVRAGGDLLGGRIGIRGSLRQERTGWTYRAMVTGRQMEAERLEPLINTPVRGSLQFDAHLTGLLDGSLPNGTAHLQAAEAGWRDIRVEQAQCSVSMHNGRLELMPLIASGASGSLAARGSVDTGRHTLDLQVEANELNLGRLVDAGGAAGARPYYGTLFLRSGRITGPWRRPDISGTLYGYGLGDDRVRTDYAEAVFSGDTEKITIDEMEIRRLPAVVKLAGVVRRPFSGAGLMHLSGDFDRLELREALRLAAVGVPLTGRARGEITLSGPLDRPSVLVEPINVQSAALDELRFTELTAAVHYQPGTQGGTWHLNNLSAVSEQGTIRGSAQFDSAQRFQFDVTADKLNLDLLQPYLGRYATVQGTGSSRLRLGGIWTEAGARDLSGEVTATSRELRINGVDPGDLRLLVTIRNDVVRADRLPFSSAPIQFGEGDDTLAVQNLRWNRITDDLTADVTWTGLEITTLQRFLNGSPSLSQSAVSFLSKVVDPAGKLFAGTLQLGLKLRGSAAQPVAAVTWKAQAMTVGPQRIQQFEGDVEIQRDAVRLRSLQLAADSLRVTADAGWDRSGRISGTLEAANFDMQLIRRWLPDVPAVQGLSGTVDSFFLRAGGTTESPVTLATLDASDITYIQDTSTKSGGRLVRLNRISVARAKLADGRLTVDNLGARFRDPFGSEAPVIGPARPGEINEVHVDLELPLRLASPWIDEKQPLRIALHLPEQRLDMLRTLVPGLKMETNGTVEAELALESTLEAVRNPSDMLQNGKGIRLTGYLSVLADRVRIANMTTVLQAVDMHLAFEEGRMEVRRNPKTGRDFTARVAVIDPTRQSVLLTGDPIKLSGSFGLMPNAAAGGAPLTLECRRVPFAESPLPVFLSGRTAGELGTQTDEPGIRLQLAGDLSAPRLSGDIRVHKTLFRLPNFPDASPIAASAPVINPQFDVRFHIGEKTRVQGPLLAAEVTGTKFEPVHLEGSLAAPRVNGTVEIAGGALTFPTARFTIQKPSTVSVRYPAFSTANLTDPSVAILMDVKAVTRINATSINGERKRYTLTVEAKGPLNSEGLPSIADANDTSSANTSERRLRLTFTSDPADLAVPGQGYDRRIAGILGGQDALQGLFSRNNNVGRVLGEQFNNILSSSVLPELFARTGIASALGFDELTLDYSGIDALTLRASRNLFGPFSIAYWRRLSPQGAVTGAQRALWELKGSYRLNSRFQFSYTTSDQRINALLLEGVFRF
jgi:hypothetical protein